MDSSNKSTINHQPSTILWIALCVLAGVALGTLLMSVARGVVTTAADIESYACNGTTKSFVFHFGVWATSQVKVLLVTNATGAQTTLVENGTYTVTLPNDDGWLTPGGTVTTTAAYSSAYTLFILRNLAGDQSTNYSTASSVDLKTLEDDFDKSAVRDAQLQRQIRRSIRTPDSDVRDMNLPSAVDRAGGYLGFDASGDVHSYASLSPASAAATTWWKAVLEASNDANAAKKDLGIPMKVYDVTSDAYGAKGDGDTNDTAAFNLAIAAARAAGGGVVYVPAGLYRVQLVLSDTAAYTDHLTTPGISKITIRGQSGGTHLMAIDDNDFALTVTGSTGWDTVFCLEDLIFDGNDVTYGGVDVNQTTPGVLGLAARNLSFWRCTYGFRNYGALWYNFTMCTWTRCGYGVWLKPKATMHGGCGLFTNCNWYINSKAAVYIDAETGSANTEQLEFHGGINEGNTGFAFFVEHWYGAWPLLIDHVYFESNGSGSSAVIDGNTYDADSVGQFHFKDCHRVVLLNSDLGPGGGAYGGGDIIDSRVQTQGCYFYNALSDYNCVNSTILSTRPVVSGIAVYDANNIARGGFEALGDIGTTNNKVTMRVELSPFLLDAAATNLWSNGDMQRSFTPTGPNSLTYSLVQGDAPQWGQYLKVRLPHGHDYTDGMRLWDNTTEVANAAYVWSFDVRSEANDAEVRIQSVGGLGNWIQVNQPMGLRAVPWEWRRFYGMGRSSVSQSAADLYIYQTGTNAEVFDLANFQLVKVNRGEDAIRYIAENRFARPAWLPRTYVDPANKTANYAVAAGDNGKSFLSEQAVTYELPPATIGLEFAFTQIDTNDLTVDPNGSESFLNEAAGHYIRLDDKGCHMRIRCEQTGSWTIVEAYDPNMTDHEFFKQE